MTKYSGVLLLLMLPIQIACAWETDVHYGLTVVLAKYAGFDDLHAKEIAKANQGVDTNPRTDAISIIVRHVICNRTIEEADQGSRLVQQLHFPARGKIPSAPIKRPVLPNSPDGGQDVVAANGLVDLGRKLHAYQDSWSHRGVPDVPISKKFQIQPSRIWSHPSDRGGWASHDADLTYVPDNDKAVWDMAESTFRVLQQFLRRKENQGYGKLSDKHWGDVAKTIDFRRFVIAKTKSEKYAWFEKHGMPRNEIIEWLSEGVNLEGGPDWKGLSRTGSTPPPSIERMFVHRDQVPQVLLKRIHEFAKRWLQEQNSLNAAEGAFSVNALRQQLAEWGYDKSALQWAPPAATQIPPPVATSNSST